jgi:DNA polymerase III gamma/tau subunit
MEENLANTRGIDDIRGMISSAKNMPTLGNFRVYILDEFHQITTAAANALLKMLEEPPPHTVWILATTNPEKILGTIYGRALKLKTQPISEEILCKCLYQIAKKEGFDLKDIKDYKDILKTIYQVCEGRPREAISLLESLLFSLEGGSKATAKDVIKTFMQTSDAEVEQLAADLIYAVISGNLKQAMTAILASKGNIRQLVSKARWLIHNVVCDLTGQQGFNTYGKRLLATKIRDSGGKVKIKLPIIINFQYQLCSLEKDLNYMSIDEVVMATAYIGNFLTQPRPPQSNGQP